jgi:hypothetical protein
MRTFWRTCRRESRKHPSVLVLASVAMTGLALGPILMAAGLAVLGEFVTGVAVAPLMLALYLCLLPVGPWPDDSGGPGPGHGDDPPAAPDPRGEPDDTVDWERFERELWAHVDQHVPVA